MTTDLSAYIKSLGKELKSAQSNFWKEMKIAEDDFHKAIVYAMREYEKVEYSKERVPGALASASEEFDNQYDAAYRAFGREGRGY